MRHASARVRQEEHVQEGLADGGNAGVCAPDADAVGLCLCLMQDDRPPADSFRMRDAPEWDGRGVADSVSLIILNITGYYGMGE